MSSSNHDLKKQLAMAVRMLERIQLLDMNGHVSYRLPGTDTFIINSRQASRATLCLSDIVLCDLEGNVLEGDKEPPSEFYIHASIYKKRDDVNSVVHGHPHWQTVLGIADIDMQPVFGIGSFIDRVNVYEKSALVHSEEMGDEIADLLGDSKVVQLRHHGTVVVDKDIQSAFVTAVFAEENAKKQYYAWLANQNMKVLQGENLQQTRETNFKPSVFEKVWNYYVQKGRIEGVFEEIDN